MQTKVIITQDPKELEKAYAIRRKVFIEEQKVPVELEMDEYDSRRDTKHLLLVDEEGETVGTARFRPYGNGILKVERVAVLIEERHNGMGRMIIQAIEQEAKTSDFSCMKLGAQLHAKKFYEGLGFQACGEVYLEAGIEHVDMVKRI